jgi:hypothetical protein
MPSGILAPQYFVAASFVFTGEKGTRNVSAVNRQLSAFRHRNIFRQPELEGSPLQARFCCPPESSLKTLPLRNGRSFAILWYNISTNI